MSSSGFLPGHLEDLVGRPLDDLGPRVVALVDAVPEALEALPARPRLDRRDEVRHVLDAADVGQHADDRLVGAAVARSVQRRRRGRRGRVGIGVRGADDSHGRGRAVLLVVGVEDEQEVEGPGQHGVGLEPRLGDLPEHGEEVGGEVERVVGVDEGHPDAEAVRGGGQRRHLGDQTDDLLVPGLRIEDVLGVEVEGRQRGDGRDEHAHGMGVVVEALEEALADVLVDERVVRDVVAPFGELLLVGQLAR